MESGSFGDRLGGIFSGALERYVDVVAYREMQDATRDDTRERFAGDPATAGGSLYRVEGQRAPVGVPVWVWAVGAGVAVLALVLVARRV